MFSIGTVKEQAALHRLGLVTGKCFLGLGQVSNLALIARRLFLGSHFGTSS
jgi:hypothetical protein